MPESPQLAPHSLDRALVWFRRDLRDVDHAALSAALRAARAVYCTFLFDRDILDALPRQDRRVEFIRESLVELDLALRARGGGLIVRHGRAAEEIPALARQLGVQAVFANRDYEPQAKLRDARVAELLGAQGVRFHAGKDQAVFDGEEVLTGAGRPYTVFTPYSRAWLKLLATGGVPRHASEGALAESGLEQGVPSLAALSFVPSNLSAVGIAPGMAGAAAALADFRQRMDRYDRLRDYPAVKGVSYLSVHLRFGTVSIRQLVREACAVTGPGAETWLKELVWRDFYFQILDHFPHVAQSAFKPAYDAIVWDEWPEGFAAWCAGKTGYPLVDAAMRQLAHSGYMHNRLRMVVASFLTKDLGIHWQQGEAFFATHLNDFDLSANNGGWQWAASSGCDAQPYFRIFNPVTQSERFDPEGRFIRRYVPELKNVPDKFIHAPWQMSPGEQAACGVCLGRDYPLPIVEHEKARQKTLARYAVVKAETGA